MHLQTNGPDSFRLSWKSVDILYQFEWCDRKISIAIHVPTPNDWHVW